MLAAEVCASAWVMLGTPRLELVWEYWLPTPFASFPFTSPPVHHCVPPGSEWANYKLSDVWKMGDISRVCSPLTEEVVSCGMWTCCLLWARWFYLCNWGSAVNRSCISWSVSFVIGGSRRHWIGNNTLQSCAVWCDNQENLVNPGLQGYLLQNFLNGIC